MMSLNVNVHSNNMYMYHNICKYVFKRKMTNSAEIIRVQTVKCGYIHVHVHVLLVLGNLEDSNLCHTLVSNISKLIITSILKNLLM